MLQRVGQFGIPEALLVEVGAYAEDYEHGGWAIGVGGRARSVEELDESARVRLVGAEGERLLELIHDDDRTGGGGCLALRPRRDGLPHRVSELRCAGLLRRRLRRSRDHTGELRNPAGQLRERITSRYELQYLACLAVLVVQCAVLQCGHQTGVQQGGLTRPRGAHEHDQATRHLRCAELGNEGICAPLSAEEPMGVLLTIRSQSPVRAHPRDDRDFVRMSFLVFLRCRGAVADRVGYGALP
nr:hypothetical protein [Streptomyces sp. ISL-99]